MILHRQLAKAPVVPSHDEAKGARIALARQLHKLNIPEPVEVDAPSGVLPLHYHVLSWSVALDAHQEKRFPQPLAPRRPIADRNSCRVSGRSRQAPNIRRGHSRLSFGPLLAKWPEMSAVDAVDGSSTGARAPWMWVLLGAYDSEEPDQRTITTIGLDIAKSVFQVHGTDVDGNVVVRRQLKRRHVLAFFQKLPRRM